MFVPDEKYLFFTFHLPVKHGPPPEDQKKLRTSKKSVLGMLLGRLASAECKLKRRRKDAQFGGMAVFLREDDCHSP